MTIDLPDRPYQGDSRVAQLEAELASGHARIAALEQRWDQWLRLISHDFRGPLTLILGYSQNALHHLPDGPEHELVRHDLNAAMIAAQRLEKMIGETVDAARLEAHRLVLAPMEVDLGSIVREQVQKARRRYPGRKIRTCIANDLALLTTDPRRVGQILAALLSNAILFSPDTSTVSIGVKPAGNQVVVSAADAGVGLTDEEREHLFERFYRHERARDVRREGLGLSLLVSEQLAARLGGRLWVESPGAGRGSTFSFSLPYQGPACAV